MRQWSARVSLLGRFSLMSFAVIAALGLAIGLTLKKQIEQRALARASQLAEVVAELGVQSRLQPADLDGPLPAERIRALDLALADFASERGVERLKVFNTEARIVYSDDHGLIGKSDEDEDSVAAALRGNPIADLQHGTDDNGRGGRTLEVYTPLRFAGGDTRGALEIYMPYGPVADEIRTDVLAVYLLLGGGLFVLFVALFRIVAGASRRLQHQALHDGLTDLQPHAALPAPAPHHRPGRQPLGPAADRPRPLQGGQRHARARPRRRAPGRGRRPPARCPAPRRHARPPRRRRVRRTAR